MISSWASGDIASLFGTYYAGGTGVGWLEQNQVFRSDQYREFLCEAQNLLSAGKPVVFQGTYDIVQNNYWGIQAGGNAEILWIVNQKCRNFENHLPLETQEEINSSDGEFPGFPFYATAFMNGPDVTQLTTAQINLLAAQTEYAINKNAEMIHAFILNSPTENVANAPTLSAGAITGISIAVIVAVAAIIATICWAILRDNDQGAPPQTTSHNEETSTESIDTSQKIART